MRTLLASLDLGSRVLIRLGPSISLPSVAAMQRVPVTRDARPWDFRSGVVAHGAERFAWLVIPDTPKSPGPYGGDCLPLDELAGGRLRYAQVVRGLRHVHEAFGQVIRFE